MLSLSDTNFLKRFRREKGGRQLSSLPGTGQKDTICLDNSSLHSVMSGAGGQARYKRELVGEGKA